ncbi:hypothetical protein GCM10022381_30350 [Leifsonia kafniensis]|uniref:Uncharacterized protein n=1 Tax=Leifsonia kafniensis TaxID=475957 RepID=A0ABP7KV96_9MICO
MNCADSRFTQIIELATLADAGGLEIMILGEHHRPDFSMSAPDQLAFVAGGEVVTAPSINAITLNGVMTISRDTATDLTNFVDQTTLETNDLQLSVTAVDAAD